MKVNTWKQIFRLNSHFHCLGFTTFQLHCVFLLPFYFIVLFSVLVMYYYCTTVSYNIELFFFFTSLQLPYGWLHKNLLPSSVMENFYTHLFRCCTHNAVQQAESIKGTYELTMLCLHTTSTNMDDPCIHSCMYKLLLCARRKPPIVRCYEKFIL